MSEMMRKGLFSCIIIAKNVHFVYIFARITAYDVFNSIKLGDSRHRSVVLLRYFRHMIQFRFASLFVPIANYFGCSRHGRYCSYAASNIIKGKYLICVLYVKGILG